MRNLTILCLIIINMIIVGSCKNQNTKNILHHKFTTYIESYTGGLISDKSTIQIQLTTNPNEKIEGKELFEFSPNIEGTIRNITPNLIEFIPKQGELVPGKTYECKFHLGKVLNVKNRELRKFDFKFKVKEYAANLKLVALDINTTNSQYATIKETLNLSNPMSLEEVKEAVKVKGITESNLIISEGINPMHYYIEINNIPRNKDNQFIEITFNAEKHLYKKTISSKIRIPKESNKFNLCEVVFNNYDLYTDLYFNNPIDPSIDINKLIDVDGISYRYTKFSIQNNRIRINFKKDCNNKISAILSREIKDFKGNKLAKDERIILKEAKILPAVKFPFKGNIMPNSKDLIIPFMAVNLKAVDLKITKIFSDNMLSFLQENLNYGFYSLHRYGRVIYERSIRLDSNLEGNQNQWQEYSIDLSDILTEEPGAYYKLELKFKKDYIASLSTTGENQNPQYNGEEMNLVSSDNFAQTNIAVSNLGLTCKYNGAEDMWVHTNEILTTKPVFGAHIYVYDMQLRQIGYEKSNPDGLANIKLSGKPYIVMARRNNSISYVKLSQENKNSLSNFDTNGEKPQEGLKAFIYGERGIYRPGDTLYLTMIINNNKAGGEKTSNTHPAILELYTPDRKFYQKQICSENLNGFYTFNIKTKVNDPTGVWKAYFHIGNAKFEKEIKIENIKANRLKIDLQLENSVLDANKNENINLKSTWLSGTPAANLKAIGNISFNSLEKDFSDIKISDIFKKSLDGIWDNKSYNFYSPITKHKSLEDEYTLFNDRLNNLGELEKNIELPKLNEAPGILKSTIICRVEEKGGNASYSTTKQIFSPFSSYVGVSLPNPRKDSILTTSKDYYFPIIITKIQQKFEQNVEKNAEQKAEVNAEQKAEQNAEESNDNRSKTKNILTLDKSKHKLKYEIYKLNWKWWWNRNNEDLYHLFRYNKPTPIHEEIIETNNGKGKIHFNIKYPENGRYLIYITDLQSGHSSGGIVYVQNSNQYSDNPQNETDNEYILPFKTDKKSYSIGETARIEIPANKGSYVLVSLENSDRVISREWVKCKDKVIPYKFKISRDMGPDLYIHLSLYHKHSNFENNFPNRQYGINHVKVINNNSHLHPEIIMPDVIHPKEEFKIKIKEKNGKPMTYTLAIVDEGLLDLTLFKTPNPWEKMYAKEGLNVDTWDNYNIKSNNIPMAECAYDMNSDNIRYSSAKNSMSLRSKSIENKKESKDYKMETRFNPIVRFLGPFSITTGSSTHKITLPNYYGKVRVMVIAGENNISKKLITGEDKAYGCAEKTVPVRSPLQFLSSVPSQLRVGEKINLPITIFADNEKVKEAKITVYTNGCLRINSKFEEKINLNNTHLDDFKIEGIKQGKGKIRIVLTGKLFQNSDNKENRSNNVTYEEVINIDVENPNSPIQYFERKLVNAKDSVTLYNPVNSKEIENYSGRINFNGFPAPNYNCMFKNFETAIYDSNEQIASKGIGLLSIFPFISEAKQDKAKQLIENYLERIYSAQLPSGGFAYWKVNQDLKYKSKREISNIKADLWISSLAGHFMCLAKEQGYDKNSGALLSWINFQRKHVRNYSHISLNNPHYKNQEEAIKTSQIIHAYQLYTLALAGYPEKGAMNRMQEYSDVYRPAKELLASAYCICKNETMAKNILLNLDSSRKSNNTTSYYRGTYGSKLRNKAIELESKVLTNDLDNAFDLAEDISKEMDNSYNTQSLAFASAAMNQLAKKLNNEEINVRVLFTPKTSQNDVSTNQSFVNIKPNYKSITINNNSKGIIYVTKTESILPKKYTPTKATSSKIHLNCKYTNMNGDVISPEVLKQGEVFTVEMSIKNMDSDHNYENLYLNYRIPSGWEINNQTKRDGDLIYYFSLAPNQELKFKTTFRAAYIGDYILPSIYCSSIYNPTCFSRTKSSWCKIIKE